MRGTRHSVRQSFELLKSFKFGFGVCLHRAAGPLCVCAGLVPITC